MENKKLTAANGRPVADNQNIQTVGPRGQVLLQDPWFLEKLAHFDREVIPERRMHAFPHTQDMHPEHSVLSPSHMTLQSTQKQQSSVK